MRQTKEETVLQYSQMAIAFWEPGVERKKTLAQKKRKRKKERCKTLEE